MKLRVRILNGPLKGRYAPVQEGVIIGRGPGTLSLDDVKVSGKHAKITKNSAGQWFIQDLGSTNGIKADGRRVKDLLLTPGVRMVLGKTELLIESVDAPPPIQQPNAAPPATAPESLPDKLSTAAPKEEHPPEWPEYFSKFVSKTKEKIKNKRVDQQPFPQILRLRVLRGLQLDWEWHMGYGPREIGRDSLDFPLYDPKAPEQCFTITPTKSGAKIQTEHEGLVLLNDQSFSAETLKDGDLVRVGENLIEVKFLDVP